MADLSDVEVALRSLISQIIYPHGTSEPSITGGFVKITRGWPLPNQLDADLKAGKVNVTIFPQDNESRTTRYPQEWRPFKPPMKTLTLTVAGNSVTVSGAPSPANVAVIVNGKAFVYQAQPADTVESIAQGLSGLIDNHIPSTVADSTVTIPGAYRIEARVGGMGSLIREIRRQKRGFQVTCWCAKPEQRDAIASAIDNALAKLDFIPLPDGSSGRILYERSHVEDTSQEVMLYRRDLFYSVEYPTTETADAAEIVVAPVNVQSI